MAAENVLHPDIVRNHPCFSAEAHFNKGRIHLPVSPVCNIQCRFCKRDRNKWEQRPGVARQIITPEAAVELVGKALELCPQISVVGIAGPGDTLATDHALNAFRAVSAKFPELLLCLSTNGLKLAEKAEELAEVGVAVEAKILPQLCAGVFEDGQWQSGEEAAQRLIDAQLEGIRKVSALGVAVKVNIVLVPGVNDHHIETIARTVREAGAGFINVIPLIPQHEMACVEVNAARDAVEKYLPAFRHCRQCRADACGIPGRQQDFSSLLYNDQPLTFSHG